MQSTRMPKVFEDKEDSRVRLQVIFGSTLPPGVSHQSLQSRGRPMYSARAKISVL